MFKRTAAALAAAVVLALGETGAALAAKGADDPPGHHRSSVKETATRASTIITGAIAIRETTVPRQRARRRTVARRWRDPAFRARRRTWQPESTGGAPPAGGALSRGGGYSRASDPGRGPRRHPRASATDGDDLEPLGTGLENREPPAARPSPRRTAPARPPRRRA